MNKHHLHPDDRQLQRFLSNHCSELELKQIGRHIQGCPDCRTRLRAYLDMEVLLDDMPVMAAPAGLEDRVMNFIQMENQGSRIARETSAANQSPKSASRWRPELMHGLVATAATYIFVSSGILGKLLSINADQLGADVQSKLAVVGIIVHRISIQLLL
ncbi:anti-sigma factor family protein [Paenibacillus sp. NPDC056579]|uniref:anti-sigma factor family protein n=1 Tax=unclassified Paenibacillus TaxID=185978 RepID=UPI001EF811BA|nr:hypothetical protein [Paenibacillus sp. H1-7]ULL18717.1 hypothetical protein DVH26_32345 [Paenibacillus sp. H1-7]